MIWDLRLSKILNKFNYFFDNLNTASSIRFIDRATILKITKPIPNQPNIIAIERRLAPRSFCSNSSIKFIFKIIKLLIFYL